MKSFTAIYFHQVNQYLSRPLHPHSTHDTIIQEILTNPTRMRAYIVHTDDSVIDLQQIMQVNDLLTFKNNIIFLSLSFYSNQSKHPEFIIEEIINVKHQNLRCFSCQLDQGMELLPIHKIITHIDQLLSAPLITSSQTECTNQPIDPKISSNVCEKIKTEKVGQAKVNALATDNTLSGNTQLKLANELLGKSIMKKFCSETVVTKNTVINIMSFIISNIQTSKKLFNTQPSSCFSFIPAFSTFNNHRTLQSTSSIKTNNTKSEKNIVGSSQLDNRNLALWSDKKIYYLNILEQNHQTLLNYHAQTIETSNKNDCQIVANSGYYSLNKHFEGNNNLARQQECEKHNLLEPCILLIASEGTNKFNLQIKIVQWEEIILLPKTQFNELLQSLLCRIVKNSSPLPQDIKEPSTPNGIICIKLSLLQKEMENKNAIKMISLINLLNNYFNYVTFVYSEDSHLMQQEIVKKFQHELQIGGQILINSDEKASKTYDLLLGRFICIFPNDHENWSNFFEINRNNIFCVDDGTNKIIVSVYEEQLEYQHLFEALHKIYEDQFMLRIFDIQDKLSDSSQQLLSRTSDFAPCTNNQGISNNNENGHLFLVADNNKSMLICQPDPEVGQEEDEITQYKRLFATKMYSFCGVNTPFCCLSYQSDHSNQDVKKSNEINGSNLCLMIEQIKECQFVPQSFIASYKSNRNKYYYYPSILKEGPLVGFGSALLAANLLGETDFFGNEFQNVCFIKKNGYFEFTKLAASSLFFHHKNKKSDTSMNEEINIILIDTGIDTITVDDLCEYDKFEIMVQILKINEPDRFAEELWNQFINTKYTEQFKHFEHEWICKLQKITKILLKDSQSSIKSIEKQSSSSIKQSLSKNSFKNIPATTLPSLLNERNTFFTRKAKYVAEETELGAGCFGVVSIAHSIKDPTQKFALKRLFDNKRILRDGGEINAGKDSAECNYKEEHDRELEALIKVKRIRSPFLVGYIGAQLLKNEIRGTHRLELIMELCNGDLTSYLKFLRRKKEKWSLSKCYDIFSQIVEGMKMLHKNGIMHRDIKPQNILYKKLKIEGDEVIVWKIGDFGLASMKTSLNNAAGTPEYIAPEIFGGEEYDKAVDVWSLGLVFHKILFGYSYYSKNRVGTEYKLSSEEFEKVGKETNDLLMIMMERDKKKRITIDGIHVFLKNNIGSKEVKKIIEFDEDNERGKNRRNNLSDEDEDEEEAKKFNEIMEIWNNAHEWSQLCCYNKAYNMLMDVLLIVNNSENIIIENNLFCFLHDIGNEAFKLGKFNESLEFYERSLSICAKVNGEEHIQTASIYQGIGSVLEKLGKYDDALACYNRSLTIEIQHYGQQHIKTAFTYNNIANVHSNLGKYQKALTYYNFTLSIFVKQYGEQHVKTASIYNNIGSALQSLGIYKEALQYHNYALPIKIKHYGEQHAQTASTYTNIGTLLKLLGKYGEALTYYNRALPIFLKHYGEQHFETASVYNGIGSALEELGKYEETLTYYSRAVLIKVKLYGEQHVQTALAYNNIGVVLLRLGKFEEAITYLNPTLSIFVRQYGEQHVQTAITYNNIGIALCSLGKYEEALSYLKCALSIKFKHYGEQHVQTALTYVGIGNLYVGLNQHFQALQYFQKSLQIFARFYGNNHPKTMQLQKLVQDLS